MSSWQDWFKSFFFSPSFFLYIYFLQLLPPPPPPLHLLWREQKNQPSFCQLLLCLLPHSFMPFFVPSFAPFTFPALPLFDTSFPGRVLTMPFSPSLMCIHVHAYTFFIFFITQSMVTSLGEGGGVGGCHSDRLC